LLALLAWELQSMKIRKAALKQQSPFIYFVPFRFFFIFHDEKKGLLKRTNGLSFEQLYCYWGSIKIIIFEKN
jgi:hypothetical protein